MAGDRVLDLENLEAAFSLHLPSPLLPLRHTAFLEADLKVWVKREDLIHPYVSGNKWRKLKYHLLSMRQRGMKRLLTFGGAHSNHLYAVAYVVKALALEGIAIVRGERVEPLNKTLAFVEESGMKLEFVSRSDYRRKREKAFLDELNQKHGPFYLIPEGGTSALAFPGIEEMVFELLEQLPQAPDYIALACGTGGTLTGIVLGLAKAGLSDTRVLGFSALKGDFLKDKVAAWLGGFLPKGDIEVPWSLRADYHFGGFARSTPQLETFMEGFRQTTGIPIEHVYTGKMFYGLLDLVKSGYFPKGSSIVAIHTGGLRV